MRYLLTTLFCLLTLCAFGSGTESELKPDKTQKTEKTKKEKKEKAKKAKKQKTVRVRASKPEKHVKTTVYLFGFSNELGDSVHYITGISRMDSIDITKKSRFMTYRESYAYQMRVYVEGVLQHKSQTTAIFFDTKLKRVQKMYVKLIAKYLNADGIKLITISPEDFTFKSVETDM